MGFRFNPGCKCCGVDCTVFSDDFDRSTGPGADWSVVSGTWTTATTDGGQLATSSAWAWLTQVATTDGNKASVDVTGSGQLQIVLASDGLYVGAELDTDAGTFSIVQIELGAPATLVAGASGLTGGTPTVTVTGSPYTWSVAVGGSPTGGTYTLAFTAPSNYDLIGGPQTATATANWNDNGATIAANLQTAIQALTGLSGATVTAAADTGTSPNLTHSLTISGVAMHSVSRTVLRQCSADDDEGTIAICGGAYGPPGAILGLFTAYLNDEPLLTWAGLPAGCAGGVAILMTGSISGSATFENFSYTKEACGQAGCTQCAVCCWPVQADGTLPAEMQVVISGAECDALNGTYLLPQTYPGAPADLDSDESGLTGGMPTIATAYNGPSDGGLEWTVVISGSPTGGTYDLIFSPGSVYSVGPATATINWNDPGTTVASKLQTAIRALTGLSGATVEAEGDAGTSPNLTHRLYVFGVTEPSCAGALPDFFEAPSYCCACYVLSGLSISCGDETVTEIIFLAFNGGDGNNTCNLYVQAPGLPYQFDVGLGPVPTSEEQASGTYSTTDGCGNSATLSADPTDREFDHTVYSGIAVVSIP